MSDRAALTMTVKSRDPDALDRALHVFETWAHPENTTREEGVLNTADYEVSLGTISDVWVGLKELVDDDGLELAFQLNQDGYGGDLGWQFCYVPEVGEYIEQDFAEGCLVVRAETLDEYLNNLELLGGDVFKAVDLLTKRSIREAFKKYAA